MITSKQGSLAFAVRLVPALPLALALAAGPAACSSAVTVVDTGGGGGGAGGASTAEAQSGVLHAACGTPTPAPLPPLPLINASASGHPRFDDWRDLDCDAPSVAKVATCDDGGCPLSGMCLEGTAGGVCIPSDSDLWCDGEGEVLGFRDGACWICGLLTAHAQACCLGLPGFDCRAWPYPADGVPGTACARHEDCEPGLVCGGTVGKGYGICQCPEVSGQVTPAATCTSF